MENNYSQQVKMRKKVLRQRRSYLAAIATIFLLTALVSTSYAADTGQITGTVTDSSDNPLQDVEVYAYDLQDTTGFPPVPVTTDSYGTYTVSGLLPGEYRYKVLFFDPNSNYTEQWYNNAPFSDCAEPLTVTAGGSQDNIDAILVQGVSRMSQRKFAAAPRLLANSSSISGQVTLDGVGLKCAKVEAYSTTNGSTWVDWVYTDYQGNYTFSLASGSYKILFYDQDNNTTQWYKNKAEFSCAASVSETSSGVDAAFPVGNLQQCTTLAPVINLLLN